MATTPPQLQTSVQTPPTPLHGAKYNQNRHSTRKGTRHTRSRALETPPPNPQAPSHKSPQLRTASHTYSPPSSTHTSPRKHSNKRTMSSRNPEAGAANGSHLSNEVQDHTKNPSSQIPSLRMGAGMLPTPAKTPRKKQVQPSAINGTARVLFPVHPAEDAMPTPRKRRNKRHTGLSLYSSQEDEEDDQPEDQIQIYTDSKEKIPELDPSEDNPFYENPAKNSPPPAPSKGRNSKKRKAPPSAEDRKGIKEAFDRDEGMVYVFRGKKVYRKFPSDGSDVEEEEATSELDTTTNHRPLTRSSIKPRLLFPTQKQRQERTNPPNTNTEDEEATTDIEEQPDTPMSGHNDEEEVTTPRKQVGFSPATPPTTVHATRQATRKAADENVEAVPYKGNGKRVSPFDGWARSKSAAASSGSSKSKKREAGEALEKGEGGDGDSKKMKG
ncbi:hypothetical protein ACLMJK_003166 [Lecanora helva]